MREFLTRVEIAFYPDYLNDRLRFGAPVEHIVLDRRRSMALFEPGQIFGYVRWRADEYGTQDWRFTIVEACEPVQRVSRIPGVMPGGKILLLSTGRARVKRALVIIDWLESAGFKPDAVSPAYYRHVHNRIAIGGRICVYLADQHAAHQAAKRVRP